MRESSNLHLHFPKEKLEQFIQQYICILNLQKLNEKIKQQIRLGNKGHEYVDYPIIVNKKKLKNLKFKYIKNHLKTFCKVEETSTTFTIVCGAGRGFEICDNDWCPCEFKYTFNVEQKTECSKTLVKVTRPPLAHKGDL